MGTSLFNFAPSFQMIDPGGLLGRGKNIERWVKFNRLLREYWGWKTNIPSWIEKLKIQHRDDTVAVYLRI